MLRAPFPASLTAALLLASGCGAPARAPSARAPASSEAPVDEAPIAEAEPRGAAPDPAPRETRAAECPEGTFADATFGCQACPRWLQRVEALGWCATWAPVGAPSLARSHHTATLLRDGRVLIAGGAVGGAPTATTAIFDPAADAWAEGPPMAEARDRHTATLLADGRVLVVGGRGEGGALLASAELFDPAAGAWSPTGSLREARTMHAAARLADGRVVIAGGSDARALIATVEIYDPARGAFAHARPLPEARAGASVHALRDGSVVVIGGYRPERRRGRGRSLAAIGAPPGSTHVLRGAPGAGGFRVAAELPRPIALHAAVSREGDRVLFVAEPDRGLGAIGSGAGPLLAYDAARDTIDTIAMTVGSGDGAPAMAAMGAGVVVAWGAPSASSMQQWGARPGPPSSVWVADDGSGVIALPPVGGVRDGHTATTLGDGRLLLVGGTRDDVAEAYRALLLIAIQGRRRGQLVAPDDPLRAPGDAASRATLERLRARFPG